MKRVPAVFSIVLVLVAGGLWAKEAPKNQKRNPRLLSMAPLGGHPGSSLEFRLRGEDLEGIRSVWLDCDRLTAEVKAVKEIALEKAKFSSKNYSPARRCRSGSISRGMPRQGLTPFDSSPSGACRGR